jgi:hypothetical protein
MKWRTRLAALLGILLPLPLMWLLFVGVYGQWDGTDADSAPSQQRYLVPMLTPGERQGLLSYKQECGTDTDCEAPLRCFFNMLVQHSYCADSTCMKDQHCPEGFACQTWATDNDKDLIRICSLVGVRQEGEVCLMLPREREDGCARGLLCRGLCGRPCRLSEPASCPEGYFCADDPSGPACQPTCEGRTCPEGQQCVPRGEGVSICARVHGPNCLKEPCSQGRLCWVDDSPMRTDELWMQCLQPCGTPDAAACPEGTVCHFYRCRTSCTPEDATACPPGFTCQARPKEPWTCVPDTRSGGGD